MRCKCGQTHGIFRKVQYIDKDTKEVIFVDKVCVKCYNELFYGDRNYRPPKIVRASAQNYK